MLLCPRKNDRNANWNGMAVRLNDNGIAPSNIKLILNHFAFLFILGVSRNHEKFFLLYEGLPENYIAEKFFAYRNFKIISCKYL